MLPLMILELIDEGIYFPYFYIAEDELDTLQAFLTTDAYHCRNINRYKKLLEESRDIETGGNRTYFDIKNNMVTITEQYVTNLPPFTIPCPSMIKILDDWHSIWKQQPPYIKITMDEHQNVNFIPMDTVENS